MARYQEVEQDLRNRPQHWLVTGGCGFIGSHVVEVLLTLGQHVRVLDNLSTGHSKNLDTVVDLVGEEAASRLEMVRSDLRDAGSLATVVSGVDRVIHLAAMASVPLSMERPTECNEVNVTGTLLLMQAASQAKVKQFVYASSSAVYGDDDLPHKVEDSIGRPLSPYAASKYINEVYAKCYDTAFGLTTVGCRFFNVFGPRQDPNGAYAAVIPCWIAQMQNAEPVYINGDGKNTRDFCYVKDVVQALLLAATTSNHEAHGNVFNVGLGGATDLNELFSTIRTLVAESTGREIPDVIYRDFRAGDIRHSCANIERIKKVLGFIPQFSLMEGLRQTIGAR